MLKIIFTLFILMGFLQVAQAVVPGGGSPGGINDCANGIKVKGNFDFDGTTSLRYCNGYGFDSLDGGLNVSLPCTKIAQVRYYAGSMQTCDGSY